MSKSLHFPLFAILFSLLGPLSISAQYADVYDCAHVGVSCEVEAQTPTAPTIYPNPSLDVFYIAPPQYCTVFDAIGRKLYQGAATDGIDGRGWAQGLYLLKLADGQVFKVVKL